MTFNKQNTPGPFLPQNLVLSDDDTQAKLQVQKWYADIVRQLAIREVSIYDTVEYYDGESWFGSTTTDFRTGYRKVFSIGAIAAGATSTTAHGLVNVTIYTHIYGTAVTAAPDNRPIPYSSVTAVNQQIEINVDATNINIKNGAAAPNITSAIVVLEYLYT